MTDTAGDFFETLLIDGATSITAALRQMDTAGEKILFVADDDRKLTGVVTDGDIRRWILSAGDLAEPVSRIMTEDPIVVLENQSADEIKELMLARRVECVPVMDLAGTIVGAVRWVDLFEERSCPRAQLDAPVVIMAGGQGTRMGPLTKILPKPLVPLGDTPILELIIDRFAEYGCRDFHLSINYKAELIKAYFSELPHTYRLSYVKEDVPLGTAGSLALMRDQLDKTFFLSNCDILVDADYADVMKFHQDGGHVVTIVASMKRFQVPYGVCEIEEGGTLKEIEEKPTRDYLVSTGFYVVEPSVLQDVPDGRRTDFTDILNQYLAEGRRIGVYPVSEDSWVDMGQWELYQEALGRFSGK